MSDQNDAGRPQRPQMEHHHRDIQGGRERAAVFGVSDGLVSNVSLILGVAGANPAPSLVRLAGIAGLIAGAASMAFGEYISMRAQTELLEKELALEAREHQLNPNVELVELSEIYRGRGMDPDKARELAADIMSDPTLALETHAREELGISPDQFGNPLGAGVWSFGAFSVGAIVPLAPWLITSGMTAVVASIVLSAAAAMAVGAVLGRLTEKSPVRLALRQLLFAAIPAMVTFAIGTVIGVNAA